jgi:hypothetical protein
VNVLFGGLPTKRSQKATRRDVSNIELSPSSWRYLTTRTWYSKCQVRPVYSRYKGT